MNLRVSVLGSFVAWGCFFSGLVAGVAECADVDSTSSPTPQVVDTSLAGASSSSPVAGSPLSGAKRDEVATALEAQWNGYRSEISTAEINYDSVVLGCAGQGLTLEQVSQWLDELEFAGNDQALPEIIRRARPDLLEGSEDQAQRVLDRIISRRSFYLQGGDWRCVNSSMEHVAVGQLHLVTQPQNRAVMAFHRGECEYWAETMDWFRRLPTANAVKEGVEILEEGDRYIIHYAAPASQPGSRLLVSADDGLPRRQEFVWPNTGEITRLELADEVTVYPGGVLFPTVRLQANMRNGEVELLTISVIRSAQFNIDLGADRFLLSVPAEWAWFDRRTDENEGGVWRNDVADVGEFFKDRAPVTFAAQSTVGVASPTMSWQSFWMVTNGVLMLILGLFLWKRSF